MSQKGSEHVKHTPCGRVLHAGRVGMGQRGSKHVKHIHLGVFYMHEGTQGRGWVGGEQT